MVMKRNQIFDTLRKIGETFTKPDDDWMPTLLLETETGPKIIGVPFTGPDDKELFALILPELLRYSRATSMAFIVSAWVLAKSRPAAEVIIAREGGISKHTERREIVMVNLADDREGETWVAQISREDGGPPTLGEFKLMMTEESSGRFSNNQFVKAMRFATNEWVSK